MCMYIDIVPNRTSSPAVLLRESFRIKGKTAKRTLANISHFADGRCSYLKKFLGKKKEERQEILFDGMNSTITIS
jgi:hypothetical protein